MSVVPDPSSADATASSDVQACGSPSVSGRGASRDAVTLSTLVFPLLRAWRTLLGVQLLVVILVGWQAIFGTQYFKAQTRILPPQYNQNTIARGQPMLGGESVLGNSSLNLKNPTDLFVGILRSRTILDAVIKNNGLLAHYETDSLETARKKLDALTTIASGKDGIVEIAVEDPDPVRAAVLANAYVSELQAFSAELARKEGSRRAQFYNHALQEASEKLHEADEKLRAVEIRTGFTRLRGQDEAILSTVRDLNAQIAAKEVELNTLRSYATEQNPDVVLLRNEISNLRKQMREASGEKAGQGAEAPSASQPFVALKNAPQALTEHAQYKREVAYWEGVVSVLGQYAVLGKMDETRDFSLFQVLDQAIAPETKSRPRNLVNLIVSCLGSLILTVFYVWTRAYIQARFKRNTAYASELRAVQMDILQFLQRRSSGRLHRWFRRRRKP